MTSRDVEALTYDRLNQHYRPAHALASLVLRHLSFRLESGPEGAPSFLVDMDIAFQDYVDRLADEQSRQLGMRVMRRQTRHLDQERLVSVEPDVVIGDDVPRALLDAKYKRHDVGADVYQALAYAKAYGHRRVALVYPADGEVKQATHTIWNDNVTVLVRTLPVGHHDRGFESLERRAGNSMLEIVREVTGYADSAQVELVEAGRGGAAQRRGTSASIA